jgi:hypothetical protein
MDVSEVKALVFDVFGTVVGYTSIVEECRQLGEAERHPKGLGAIRRCLAD